MAKKKTKKSTESTDIVAEINAAFGANTLISMSQKVSREYDVIPTGSRRLDAALGIGGWPHGRIVEIYGSESSGKSSLCLHAIAAAQAKGHKAAYIDAEHALDLFWAEHLGVDVDALLVAQPDCGEQALEITDRIIKSGQVGVVVVDSVAALTPRAELEGEIGDSHIGLQARMMGQALRKMAASASTHNVLVIFVNQVRSTIGGFGSGNTTPGGKALKFFTSIRVDVARTGKVKGTGKASDTIVGAPIRAKVVKNKLAPPFRECEYVITFDGGGIDLASELAEDGVEAGALMKTGTIISFADDDGVVTKIGVGKQNCVNFLREHPDVLDVVYHRVKEYFKNGAPAAPEETKAAQTSTADEALKKLMGE